MKKCIAKCRHAHVQNGCMIKNEDACPNYIPKPSKPALAPVDSIDWLACPKCAKAFDVSKIEKHHIGTLYESYKCWGCGLMSPTLTAGSLKRWWNKRAG